ncbi:MAG TPA: hypothetical protein VNU75_00065, partial [Acidimicrobiales bacterium]|nr:hypothetical protein [Acidimicrobiales bacterium]
VSEAERDEVRQAMLNGEMISPPAGAIGRGDAFVLRIAERTGATVLSNDSFQEFHGEHPWLFDDGRLVGGKPVPGVGWIFTPRVPIRGPKSRAATAEAKARDDHASAPAKAAELARAAKKAAKRASKSKKASKVAAATVDPSWPIRPNRPPPGRAKVDPVVSSAIEEAVEEALHPPTPEKPRGPSKKQVAAKKAPPQKSAKAKKDAPRGKAKTPAQPKPERDGANQRKKRSAPPPAVNEPLTFINFVAAFPVGSTVDGEVVSFTSHGAMVDVSLPGGGVLHCYIPLSAMGTPPPTKARKVLKKGEVRPFLLAGLDPPRRVAELALPFQERPKKKRAGAPAPAAPAPAKKSGKKAARAPEAGQAPVKKGPAPGKKAPAKKRPAPGKKAPAKKASAPGKTAPAKKRPPAGKKAAAKKQARRAPSKKAKAPAAAAPAKKTAKAKKVAKAAAPKAPARNAARTAGKRATGAKKTPAKKASKARR